MAEKFKRWLEKAGIRALKSVAQGALATIGTTALFSEVDWRVVISSAALMGVLSLLTSIAGLPELDKEDNNVSDNSN